MADTSGAAFARRFLLVALLTFATAGLLARGLIAWRPGFVPGTLTLLPWPFFAGTLLLASGSFCLAGARRCVRAERQRPFRRRLLVALAAGTLFVGVQGYGFWWLTQNRDAAAVETGVTGFVLAFAALHAMHFTVALLALTFVTLRAFADRYDHEYSWGVTACEFFWHALGIAWLAILAAMSIAGATLVMP